MEHYEHNLQIIKNNRKYLYDQIVNEEAYIVDEYINVTSAPTKTKDFALEVECDGNLIRLNSKYNPLQEAQKWAEQHQIKNLDTVIAMFGLGNGIFLREFLKKMNKDNIIIVYEPSYLIFRHVLELYPMEDILMDHRVIIVIQGKNDFEFSYYLSRTLTWMNLYSQIECLHPGYDKIFNDSYQAFKGKLQDNMLNNLVAKNTHGEHGKTVVENAILNIIHLKDSISFWDLYNDLPKDVPIIIVSAGPSLLKNIDVLKEAKGKSIILVVDRAYETLLKHGIEPDFVILLDAKKALKHCGNQVGFMTPLLCKLEGSQPILNNHGGKKVIYDCSEYIQNIYKKLSKNMGTITTGGSVTTAAFVLAVKFNFKRIVLIGSDLAYAGGLSHAGLDHIPEKYNSGLIELYVEDIYGGKIKTRYDWYIFLRWFESVIMQMPEYDVIDATEGGAKIKGTRIMTLKEVVDQYCTKEVDCEAIINHKMSTFDRLELESIYEYLNVGRKELDEIKEIARKTIYDCQKLIINAKTNRSDSSESQRLVKRLFEANKNIENMSIFTLVNQYVLSVGTDEIEELYFMSNDKKKDELSSYQTTEKIYNCIVEACDFIIPKLGYEIVAFKDKISMDSVEPQE
ncbi:MAG: hypothetical protein K0S01_3076 [Herbinix sp.]|jgi:hypothetical protein|nr:hypothetical protein [Herbinix sp.]